MAPASDDTIAGVMAMLRSMSNDFSGHAQKVLEIERKLDLMLTALGGEASLMSHRLFHERVQASASFRNEVIKDAIKATTRGAVWAILIGVVTVMGMGVIYWLQKTLGIK